MKIFALLLVVIALVIGMSGCNAPADVGVSEGTYTITQYDANGQIIGTWKDASDLDTYREPGVYFMSQGKRRFVSGTFVIVEN